MFSRTVKIRNGDYFSYYQYYICDVCNKEIGESSPHYANGNYHSCPECAFLNGDIDERKFHSLMLAPDNYTFSYVDSKFIWHPKNTRPPWLRNNRQQRDSIAYRNWRDSVYKRDSYTCQHCRKVGGELNAHHIKSYKDFPKLRLDVDNGLTLCRECHLNEHRKGVDYG
jgi:5-methylcytosine-specific restriction endonuclease McrA